MANLGISRRLAAGKGCPVALAYRAFHQKFLQPLASGSKGSALHATATKHTLECSVETELREWINVHQGFVHPSISLSDHAPCGSRGVIATTDLTVPALELEPLVSIPKHLHLDNHHAVAVMRTVLSQEELEAFEELNGCQQVACLLAWYYSLPHAPEGQMDWSPYLNSLPAQPPCPWLMTDSDVSNALQELCMQQAQAQAERLTRQEAGQCKSSDTSETSNSDGLGGLQGQGAYSQSRRRIDGSSGGRGDDVKDAPASWLPQIRQAHERYGAWADQCVAVCGPRLGIGKAGAMWAIGQVNSRCLGSGSSAGLLPFIDLLNHCPTARPPMLQLDDSDGLVMTVTSLRDGELAPLAAGDELYISYQPDDLTPLQAFIKFGYVPKELW